MSKLDVLSSKRKNPLKIGSRVNHPLRGTGAVLHWDDRGRVHVQYDSGDYHRYSWGNSSAKLQPAVKEKSVMDFWGKSPPQEKSVMDFGGKSPPQTDWEKSQKPWFQKLKTQNNWFNTAVVKPTNSSSKVKNDKQAGPSEMKVLQKLGQQLKQHQNTQTHWFKKHQKKLTRMYTS